MNLADLKTAARKCSQYLPWELEDRAVFAELFKEKKNVKEIKIDKLGYRKTKGFRRGMREHKYLKVAVARAWLALFLCLFILKIAHMRVPHCLVIRYCSSQCFLGLLFFFSIISLHLADYCVKSVQRSCVYLPLFVPWLFFFFSIL